MSTLQHIHGLREKKIFSVNLTLYKSELDRVPNMQEVGNAVLG